MSWLSDFAGKAENFLNAMDKSAASAINQATNAVQNTNVQQTVSTRVNTSNRKYSIKSDMDFNDAEFIETPDIMSLKTSISTSSLLSTNGNSGTSQTIQHSNTATITNKGHQRTPSYESEGSLGSKTLDEDRLIEFLNNKEGKISEEGWQQFEETKSTVESEAGSDKSHESNQSDTFSGSKLRIKEENSALIKELNNLQKRYTDIVKEYKQIQRKAMTFHNQNMTNEKIIKELQSRETEFLASVEAKDSQILALKIQLDETESNLKLNKERLYQLESDNLKLQTSIDSDSKNVNNELISNLEDEIVTLKNSLKMEREELKTIQSSNREQINRLEDNQRSLIEEIENYRRQVIEANNMKAEIEFSFNSLQKKFDLLESEYSEFKLKANKTLHDKDLQLTKALQNIGSETCDPQQLGDESKLSNSNLQLLQERIDILSVELSELQTKYDQNKHALERSENEIIPRFEYENQSLREQLLQEQTLSNNLKVDLRKLSEESKQSQDDLSQIRISLTNRIMERDEEIEKLRRQLMLKQQRSVNSVSTTFVSASDPSSSEVIGSVASADEWEQRLSTLTENLIQKQSKVEQLSSANHSLKLQLERTEQRFRELANTNSNINNDVSIGIYHSPTFTNYIKHRMTSNQSLDGSTASLMEDNPNDGQVTRKVKRAYGAIDAFSVRLGNFLRVYPSARAAFLVYIIVLHIWVAFILIYYEPEAHSSDFHS